MSETARMLDDAAGRLLERHADAGRSEAARAELLAAARDAGLPLALTPEAEGGIGGSWEEAAVIAYHWGRAAAPLPMIEMLLAGRLAGMAGDSDLAGRTSVTLAAPDATRVEFPVFEGCDRVIVLARNGEGGLLQVLPLDGAERFANLAGEPWARLDFDPASGRPLPARRMEEVVAGGCLLYVASIVGAMHWILDMAIEHANTRVQFGRPLGKFQAIQILIADAASEKLATEAALRAALRALDMGTAAPLDWLSAKAEAGRAATIMAANVHQLLGAIGFTDEHRLHHYTKRLWAWRDDWMRQSACEAAVGELALKAGGGALWSLVADRPTVAAAD